MQRYRWKGNVRELRNTVERLIIMTATDTIDVGDLPDTIRTPSGSAQRTADFEPAKASTLREFKDTSERLYLVAKLSENAWNISKTAEVIDTPRSNLYKTLSSTRSPRRLTGRASLP